MSTTPEVLDQHDSPQEPGRPHPEGGEHGDHPSDWMYIKVALFLAAVTGIEVALFYVPVGGEKNPLPNNLVLLLLAGVKFITVALFFMHLKFDNRILRRLFVSGFVLAVFCYITVLLMFGVLSWPFNIF